MLETLRNVLMTGAREASKGTIVVPVFDTLSKAEASGRLESKHYVRAGLVAARLFFLPTISKLVIDPEFRADGPELLDDQGRTKPLVQLGAAVGDLLINIQTGLMAQYDLVAAMGIRMAINVAVNLAGRGLQVENRFLHRIIP